MQQPHAFPQVIQVAVLESILVHRQGMIRKDRAAVVILSAKVSMMHIHVTHRTDRHDNLVEGPENEVQVLLRPSKHLAWDSSS